MDFYWIVAMESSNSGHGVYSVSTTTCVTYTGASQTKAMTILAIGKQQWGESLGTSSPTTVTLPIAYTSTLFAAYATPSTTGFWQAPACVERTYTLSTIQVGAYGGSASLYLKWLTVGV